MGEVNNCALSEQRFEEFSAAHHQHDKTDKLRALFLQERAAGKKMGEVGRMGEVNNYADR